MFEIFHNLLFPEYLYVLCNPLSWNIVILWHLLIGSIVLLISQKCIAKDLRWKSYLSSIGMYTAFGFIMEMTKGIFYLLTTILSYIFYLGVNSTKKIDAILSVEEIVFVILCLVVTIAFWILIYFIVLMKALISKKHRVILSTVLSVLGAGYYYLFFY